MNGFSGFGNSPAKHGTNSKGDKPHTKFKTETEHEEYHDIHPTKDLNKAEMKEASKKKNPPKAKKVGPSKINPPKAKKVGPSKITKPKTKEEMASFRAAQLETKGSDERETERINP